MKPSSCLRPLIAALALLVAACATTTSALQQARSYLNEGEGEKALAVLQQALKERPEDVALRGEYARDRELLITQWLAQAESLRLMGQFDLAAGLFRRVQQIDAANARARAGLGQVQADRRHMRAVGTAEKLFKADKYREAREVLRRVLEEDPHQRQALRLHRAIEDKLAAEALVEPQLNPTTRKPISLELHDVTLRAAFDVLSRASGINFVFERAMKSDEKTTLVVRDATVEDAMKIMLLSNQLGHKVISANTVLLYPATPQKLREYQDLVAKTFYLSNADAKQVAKMVRDVAHVRDVFVDEKLNSLVVRATPKAVRLVGRLIAAQDLAEPEVTLDVEVLEVTASRLLELGLRFPDSLAYSLVGASGTPGVVSLPEWLNRGASLVQLTFTNPLFLLTLRQQDSGTSILANPRIRVKNKELASIHVGERVPVTTTTAAATGSFVSESVSYLDVGLKLDVKPVIHLDDDVDIKVGLEVSNIVREIDNPVTGSVTYQLGTRNASTILRLHDGETQVLAGLINNQDQRSAARVPGLGDMPVLGRLFSATTDNATKTEIVLLITPHLVRTLARPAPSATEFPAGTASTGGFELPPPIPGRRTSAFRLSAPSAAPAESAPAMVPFGGVQRPKR